jgi:hypothetical protein
MIDAIRKLFGLPVPSRDNRFRIVKIKDVGFVAETRDWGEWWAIDKDGRVGAHHAQLLSFPEQYGNMTVEEAGAILIGMD